jgi:hypothetical protein
LRSIASLQRIGKYASARQFSRAPRIWPFLNSLEAEFLTVCWLHPGAQAVPVARDHGVEIVDRRIHVHGAHAIEITVQRWKRLDALLELSG